MAVKISECLGTRLLLCFRLRSIVGAWAIMLFAFEAHAEDLTPVKLQLKWQHQFQFAGYYAAIEQGYYREAGLEVELMEARPGVDPVDVVLSGEADFGVGTSELILRRAGGDPVVVLAVIYQHSPLVLLARRDGSIDSLHDLVGRKVMIEPLSAELFAYLRQEGIEASRLEIVEHSLDPKALLEERVDAMSAYSTDEPYELWEKGIPYAIFTPRSAGVDFYGDNIFTTEALLKNDPALVEAFLEASLRGWEYAVRHPEAIVDLIIEKYDSRKSREHLLFEAHHTLRLMHPELISVGYMHDGRWRHIADTYALFGMLEHDFELKGFLYSPGDDVDLRRYYGLLGILGLIASVATLWLLPLILINRRLKRAKDDAEAANLAKGRYIAFLTHEIKTPLNGIMGYLDELDGQTLSPEQREGVNTIRQTAAHLLRLVEGVLTYSRLEVGAVRIQNQPVILEQHIESVCHIFRATAKKKGLKLTWSIDERIPPIVAMDADYLREILSNLIGNAVKFTSRGEVSVRVSLADHQTGETHAEPWLLRFMVKDSGVGIEASEQAHLFEAYVQAGDEAHRRKGTGLGLAIVKQLTEVMGGTVTLDSQPGSGSCFTVILPAGRVPD